MKVTEARSKKTQRPFLSKHMQHVFVMLRKSVHLSFRVSKHMKHVDVKHKHMIVSAEQQMLDSSNRTISLSCSLSLKGSINSGASSFSHLHSYAAPCRSHPVSVHSFIGSFLLSRLLSEAQPLTVHLKQGLSFIGCWHQISRWNSSWWM